MVKIPRYYEKWCAKHHPEEYFHYVTHIKQKQKNSAERKEANEKLKYQLEVEKRRNNPNRYLTKAQNRALLQSLKQKEIKRKLD